MQLNFHLLL
ncbi:hypothetical protein Ahy_B06g080322 isoform A [Arachis hypogaea]|uniref:Uncharacterized protein n=1 Tax=Arachis hypogaea TaxID=3818 RepID=A0A444YHN9_ARAHY|nr:hypothetical protein Ahy_B06g080322 isoform A [Arachis hypogaea]